MRGAAGNPYAFLSGSALKVIALAAMTLDHVACFILAGIPGFRQVLFSIHGHNYSWCTILNCIGRSAFPLFAFLLAEGYIHTHDRRKYGLRLLAFALISEIPWNLVHTGALFYGRQNVFFTLFLGYLGICAWEGFKDCQRKQWGAILGLLAVSYFLKADYSYLGFLSILLLYLLRTSRLAQGLGTICMNTSHLMCIPAAACMCLYNSRRGFIGGNVFKYFFYAYYPLHLLVLWAARLMIQ